MIQQQTALPLFSSAVNKEPSNKRVAHVLPITGYADDNKPAIESLKGSSFLVSFYYTRPGTNKIGKQLDRAIELVGYDQMLILDNGAFTLYKNGGEMDDDYLDEFYLWASRILDRSQQAVVIMPDKIGGTPEENIRLIQECPLDTDRCMAVWHLDEPLSLLKYYAESFNHLAFGSSGKYWNVGSKQWGERVRKAFDTLDTWYKEEGKSSGYVKPTVHMLRGVGVLHNWPFDSADSSNLAVNWKRQNQKSECIMSFTNRIKNTACRGEGYGDPLLNNLREQVQFFNRPS